MDFAHTYSPDPAFDACVEYARRHFWDDMPDIIKNITFFDPLPDKIEKAIKSGELKLSHDKMKNAIGSNDPRIPDLLEDDPKRTREDIVSELFAYAAADVIEDVWREENDND